MRTYNYKLGGGTLTITFDDKGGALSSIKVEGNELSLPDGSENEAVAAIALAVDRAINEEVHDEESNVITIHHNPTNWNSPELSFHNLVKD